ncbi:MAG: hypothetical protein HOP23_16245 [Methylococcaceae bacterium]|nr:hypothetical protein [Methylococcaceae bacterium]
MSKKNSINHSGQLYYSEAAAAKILGLIKAELKGIMGENLEWCNFKVNGPIWIAALSINKYRLKNS